MKVRIGLPIPGGKLPACARKLGAPNLISAGALVRRDAPACEGGFVSGFRTNLPDLDGMDVALDSAGFVAWALKGGYEWSVAQYVELAAARDWTWWSAMDACCEPEIAGDADTVYMRQAETTRLYHECMREAKRRGISMPMPVLQGQKSSDYVRHVKRLGFDHQAPDLVGVGSMCRRHVHGPNGLLDVVDALDRVLPPNVRLHLFGVKSEALSFLAGHPRVESVDSMAWDTAARWDACKAGTSNDMRNRTRSMRRWYRAQLDHIESPEPAPMTLALPDAPDAVDDASRFWGGLVEDGETDAASAAYHAEMDRLENYHHE